MRYKVFVILFFGSLLFAVFPLVPVWVSVTVTNANGCVMSELPFKPCMVLGFDVGQTLYTLSLAVWFLFVTIPHGLVGALMGLLGMAYLFIANKVKRRKALKHLAL